MDKPRNPNAKQNALKDYKLRLVANPLPDAIQRNGIPQEPTVAIGVYDNQPRFTVYTNSKSMMKNDRALPIEANMDTFTFGSVMAAIRQAATDKDFKGLTISNKGYFYGPEGRSDKPGVKSTTYVGRTPDGEVFLGFSTKRLNDNKPILFIFRPTIYHGWAWKGGDVLTDSEVSELYALSYVDMMTKLVVNVLHDEFISYEEIKERKEQNKQNRAGGGGFKKKPQQNYQSRSEDSGSDGGSKSSDGGYDEDIPW